MKYVMITCACCGKQEFRAYNTKYCFECKKALHRKEMREYSARLRAAKRNENH